MALKQKMDQEAQIHSGRTSAEYIDTQAAGGSMETPVGADRNLLWDLNNIRSQIARIMDPATPGNWHQNMAALGFDSFGLKQIHDKVFAFMHPHEAGTTDFTLAGGESGILIDAAKIPGAAGNIAVGASSTSVGGYIAADESNFTVAGTLGVGLSQVKDSESILLNKINILKSVDNEPPQAGGGESIFGLLQTITGTSDNASIAAASSENLQISFAYIAAGTDVLTATTLPAADYHFDLPRQRDFFSLTRGALLSGVGQPLPEIISQGATAIKLPFREIDIDGTLPAANDPMVITTGVFTTAGAQTVFSSFDTPALPATGIGFRDDPRIKVWLNGSKLSKGASAGDNRDVYWVSATQIAFEDKLKDGDVVHLESPASF
jgi:hypothetical protein